MRVEEVEVCVALPEDEVGDGKEDKISAKKQSDGKEDKISAKKKQSESVLSHN